MLPVDGSDDFIEPSIVGVVDTGREGDLEEDCGKICDAPEGDVEFAVDIFEDEVFEGDVDDEADCDEAPSGSDCSDDDPNSLSVVGGVTVLDNIGALEAFSRDEREPELAVAGDPSELIALSVSIELET